MIREGTPYLVGYNQVPYMLNLISPNGAHLFSCFHTPLVCASTPSTASMRIMAPSTTLLALSTSIPKSACPGVSMRLRFHCFHLAGILADWMVIPRSRSAGKKSVVVLPASTEPADDRYEVATRIDSVNVVLPESTTSPHEQALLRLDNWMLTDVSHQGHISSPRGILSRCGYEPPE